MPYPQGDERAHAASKRHYAANKSQYYERNRTKRLAIAAWLASYKTGKPCMDCKVTYPPYVYDFDHRDPSTKRELVSRSSSIRSWKRIKEEIEKCDLVCANCHRIRTHARAPR